MRGVLLCFRTCQWPVISSLHARSEITHGPYSGSQRRLANAYHIISYHIISYHIISYHIISYHIISYHIISYHIISYHIISYHIISYHIISCHVMSCHVMSYHIISYHVISYMRNPYFNFFSSITYFHVSSLLTALSIYNHTQ